MIQIQRKIIRYIAANPGASYRAIADAVGISSTSHVRYHINHLKTSRLVDCEPGRMCTLRLASGVFVDSKGRIYQVLHRFRLCPGCGTPKQNHDDDCLLNWEPFTKAEVDWALELAKEYGL